MDPEIRFLFGLSFVALSAFYLVFILHWRTKGKPLFGDYIPGKPGNKELRNMVDGNMNLMLAIGGLVFSLSTTIFDACRIISSGSGYISFVVGPFLVAFILFIVYRTLRKTLK